ncbi:G-protein coupled receptor 56-like [Sinocyclocheilus rhinocerous]|uniref:G-protein coupled receptor 56-like n=1 Tax=Sinocyclocheilus rhinocerous TaxID=307959 RepID=UPI0007B90655|nr:PREDICTED: G-protein coupled receptor 56-like [Sinocyclocheilus rhinocerous]
MCLCVFACAQSTILEMEEGFTGLNFTLPAPRTVPPNMIPSVYLPSCLKSRSTSKVVCTYYKDKTLFQRGSSDLLGDIVGLSVENEIIKNLPEPVRISFHHSALPANYSRRCVSWDTRKDNEVTWRYDGCETVKIHDTETECCCNHLTYFAILVHVELKDTVRHLQALTAYGHKQARDKRSAGILEMNRGQGESGSRRRYRPLEARKQQRDELTGLGEAINHNKDTGVTIRGSTSSLLGNPAEQVRCEWRHGCPG